MDEPNKGSADENDSRFGRAKDFVSDKYAEASDAMKNQYNRVREQVEDIDFGEITDQVRSYVRSNPGKALLISIGVGFIIGLLLRRSDRDED
ncbi:MAG TPA: DUF883 C-terminal domain-containing protein [Thermoanaerobaculia bacterium]|jgi:ElaB/YqjD/DUF883 family membrane-anchored ribosome-binding protein